MDTFGMEPWQVQMHRVYASQGQTLGKIVPSPWYPTKEEDGDDD